MVSTLLDELPCLIDEADELMARLSCHMTLFKVQSKGAAPPPPSEGENQDVVVHYTREDLKQQQQPSPRHSSASTHSLGKGRSMAEVRQALESIDVDAVVKFFARQFLTMQAMSIVKMNANLPAGDAERSALHSLATSVYHLMKRLHHWQQAAWESLTRFFADNSSSDSSLLTFDSHPQLTRLVLATVAKYVKVTLLWTSFSVIPGLLALYSFLHYAQTAGDSVGVAATAAQYSPLEHTDHRVREFVLHFGTAPLLRIQHDFQAQVADKGASLAALALSCFERYEGCHDLAKLRHQGVFDLEALVSGAYASHSSLPDLLNAADVVDWVICVVLCVPHQLQNTEGSSPLSPRTVSSSPTSPSSPTPPTTGNTSSFLHLWDFMEIIARDQLVLTLHRNHVVNLHNLLYQQITSSLSASVLTTGTASSSMPSFGGGRSSVSLKKIMSALSKHALRNCGVVHRQRREVAEWLLQSCVQLMQHNPALVAPSFPLLLAALAVARDEIEWAMCHHPGNKPSLLPAHIKAKHLHRVLPSFNGAERELAELLTLSHRLRGLMDKHAHFLAEYYQAFLVDGDAEGIAFTLRELFTAVESTPSNAVIQPLLKGFLDRERYRVSSSSSTTRVTWVREWRQANAHLVTSTQLPLLDVLRARMECAVRHTQYICGSSQLVEHAASFSKCWWFRDVVFEQCFEQTVTASPCFSVALMEILSSLAAGTYLLDELVDTEEAAQHSERMTQRIDRMRAGLVQQVGHGLEAVVKWDVSLQRDEISPARDEMVEQVETKITASSRKLSSFSRVQSSQVQRPSSAELRLASPTAVTSSVLTRNTESVIMSSSNNASVGRKPEAIGDEENYPELVRAILDHIAQHPQGQIMKTAIVNQVRACFIRFLRDVVAFPTGSIDAATLRCSIKDACEQVRCFLRVSQRLFGGCELKGGGDTVALGEAVQVALAKALETECDSVASVLPQDKRLLEWTTDTPHVAQAGLQAWSLVDRIAWLLVSLVTKRCHPSISSTTALPAVLASVRKSCFVLYPATSREIDPRDYTDSEALRYLTALVGSSGVESICSTVSNLLVAQILKLRSSIEAEHAALAFMDMALGGGASNDVVLAPAQTRALDDIATQLVQIGTAAFLLQLLHAHSSSASADAWETRVASRVLRELQQDPDRRATWTRLLPVACSSAFHASVWRRTTYLSRVAATDTNAHMMGLAMARLLPAPHSSPAVHRCAVAALKRASTWTMQPSSSSGGSRAKLPLQLDPSSSESPAQPLLEALDLLVSTAAAGIGDVSGPHGPALGELELVLERLLPRALKLQSAVPDCGVAGRWRRSPRRGAALQRLHSNAAKTNRAACKHHDGLLDDDAHAHREHGGRDDLRAGPAPEGPEHPARQELQSARGHRQDHAQRDVHGRALQAAPHVLERVHAADLRPPRALVHHAAQRQQHGQALRPHAYGLQVPGAVLLVRRRAAAGDHEPPVQHQEPRRVGRRQAPRGRDHPAHVRELRSHEPRRLLHAQAVPVPLLPGHAHQGVALPAERHPGHGRHAGHPLRGLHGHWRQGSRHDAVLRRVRPRGGGGLVRHRQRRGVRRGARGLRARPRPAQRALGLQHVRGRLEGRQRRLLALHAPALRRQQVARRGRERQGPGHTQTPENFQSHGRRRPQPARRPRGRVRVRKRRRGRQQGAAHQPVPGRPDQGGALRRWRRRERQGDPHDLDRRRQRPQNLYGRHPARLQARRRRRQARGQSGRRPAGPHGLDQLIYTQGNEENNCRDQASYCLIPALHLSIVGMPGSRQH